MSWNPQLVRALKAQPRFVPPWWLRNPHLQTIWANVLPRPGRRTHRALACRSRRVVVPAEDGDRLRLYWDRPPGAAPTSSSRPVLIVLHGLTGHAEADNVLATASKGVAAGFDVVRVDLRNSTAAPPSRQLGHAGRSEDLRAALDHVSVTSPGSPMAVIGFSMGGNVALKAVGEFADAPPPRLTAVATISVPIELERACDRIDDRANAHFRRYFLRRLVLAYESRRERHPEELPDLQVRRIRTLRKWDDRVVAPLFGFAGADDYYRRCSALPVLSDVHVPTLLIQARDDPFIPFSSFREPAVVHQPWIRTLATDRGGHVGFYHADGGSGTDGISTAASPPDPDPYWAENRAVAFCAAAAGAPGPRGGDRFTR